MNSIPSIEPSIHTSIAKVMADVRRLEKTHENAFAKYQFTSIDDFKDMIRPLLAKYGLAVRMTETKFDMSTKAVSEKGKETTLVHASFAFEIHSASEKTEAENLTVLLFFTGPQTTGAARSYAMKEWIKTRFFASSGDIDDGDVDRQDPEPYMPKKDAKPLYDALQKELRETAALSDPSALLSWASTHRSSLMSLPPDWRTTLRDEYSAALEAAKASESLDRRGAAAT